MTIKEIIAKMFNNRNELKERAGAYEQDMRAQEIVARKRKSPEELEIEGYNDEMRKRRFKAMAKEIRKRQMDEFWHGKQILEQRNIFRDSPNIFTLRRVEKK